MFSKTVENERTPHRRSFLQLVGVAGVMGGIVPFPGTAFAAEQHNILPSMLSQELPRANPEAQKLRILRRCCEICGLGTYFGYATSRSQSSTPMMRL